MFRKITYTDKEDILGLVSIDNKNKVTAQDMNDIKNAINDNTTELDKIMVHVAGDTMTGALNFKANTWNKYGSNVAVGAINTAGTLAVKGLDGKTTIRLVPNGATDNNGVTWVANSATDSTISGTLNGSFKGPLNGNAATTTKLQTARTINGTSFNGSANITTANWGTARDITLGLTKKSVNGSTNMAWTLAEMGALPAAGGTMTGDIKFSNVQTGMRGITGTVGDNDYWRVVGISTASDAGYLEIATADGGDEPIYVRQYAFKDSNSFGTVTRTATILDASGNTTLPGLLTVNGIHSSKACTFDDNLTVKKNITCNGTLSIDGVTTLKNNANINGTLSVDGTTTFKKTLEVTGATSLKNNATVGGTLSVDGATTLKNTLSVTGASTFNNNSTFKKNATINGALNIDGSINSSLVTNTYLNGNKGGAIINSNAAAGAYTMLAKMNSINGFFTTGAYQNKYLLQYTNKATVAADTNAVTKSVTLLDEDGNATFPEKITAKEFAGKFTGNSSTATKLATARTIALTGSVTGSGTFDGSGNLSIVTKTNHTHSYLPLSGGTMGSAAYISWPDSGNWGNNNSGVTFPVDRGGFNWSGQSDGIKLYAEETANDNLELVLKFADDDSNGLSIRNSLGKQTARISASGVFTGSFSGNASTATKLQTSRKINGTNFNGSADITTDKWGTARNISISDSTGTNTGTAVSVNGSGNATLKLPATIKATLSGNASTASTAKDIKTSRKDPGNFNTTPESTERTMFREYSDSSSNRPSNHWYYGITLQGADENYSTQLALGETTEQLHYRTRQGGNWGQWKKIGFAPITTNVIAYAGWWGGGAAPYTCTINIANVTASNVVEVGLASNANDDQVKACMKASIAKITQANGSITLYAYGAKPTVDIPLSIVVMEN